MKKLIWKRRVLWILIALCALSTLPALAAIKAGQKAPAVSLKRLDGKSVSLSSFKGKTVLLDFGMASCPPCEAAAPHLQRLQTKYSASGLRIVSAMVASDAKAIKAFIKRHKVTYLIATDPGEKAAGRYNVRAHPTLVLIGRNGTIRSIQEGYVKGDEKELEAAIRKALKK
jgi:peroxiredoxin